MVADELSLDDVDALYDEPTNLANKDELTLDDLDAIDQLAEPAPTTRRRSKKDPTEDRTINGWMSLIHNFEHECTVPTHPEDRPRAKGAHYLIGDYWVCRICYLGRRDQQ